MHLLNPAPFGRILPAMITPMKPNGDVDFEAAQKLAKQLVADGADGLVVNGTTGESPVTHMDEKVDLVRVVKEVVDVPVISGAGSNDTAHTVRMVEQTQEAGADAVLVVMPYYSRPSQAGVVGHYKAVDENTDKPIIVYDVPSRTGLKVKVETYDRLAELDHVVAVKDATGDLAAAVEKQQRTGLAWYSGDDGLFLPFLSIGAVGIISVIAHVILGFPGETKEMMKDTVRHVAALPVSGIKLQLLHVLRGTALAEQYQLHPFPMMELDEYSDFVIDCLELLPPDMVVHRLTGDGPRSLLLAPSWSTDKKRILNTIHRRLKERNTRQGEHFYG